MPRRVDLLCRKLYTHWPKSAKALLFQHFRAIDHGSRHPVSSVLDTQPPVGQRRAALLSLGSPNTCASHARAGVWPRPACWANNAWHERATWRNASQTYPGRCFLPAPPCMAQPPNRNRPPFSCRSASVQSVRPKCARRAVLPGPATWANAFVKSPFPRCVSIAFTRSGLDRAVTKHRALTEFAHFARPGRAQRPT